MTTIASQIAQTIIDDLRSKISDRRFQPRLWSASDHARIYTGSRSEHLRVWPTGRVERSQPRLSWGEQIDQVLDADPTAGMEEGE